MKRTLLSAMVIAAAVSAHGVEDNPTVYENPFSGIGKMDYVQRQSDGKVGKWFLSGECGKSRSLTVEGVRLEGGYLTSKELEGCVVRAARVANVKKRESMDDLQLCYVYKVKDADTYGEFTLLYNIGASGKSPSLQYRLTIKGVRNDSKDMVVSHYSNNGMLAKGEEILYDKTKKVVSDGRFDKHASDRLVIKEYKYLFIQFDFGGDEGVYWIADAYFNEISSSWGYNPSHCFDERISRISFEGGLDDVYMCKEVDSKVVQILNGAGEEIGVLDTVGGKGVEWKSGCEPKLADKNFVGWQLDGEDYGFDYTRLGEDFTLTAVMVGGESGRIATSLRESETDIYYSNGVLRLGAESDVVIYSASGVAVKRARGAEISVEDLRDGVYLARVGESVVRFVKQ